MSFDPEMDRIAENFEVRRLARNAAANLSGPGSNFLLYAAITAVFGGVVGIVYAMYRYHLVAPVIGTVVGMILADIPGAIVGAGLAGAIADSCEHDIVDARPWE